MAEIKIICRFANRLTGIKENEKFRRNGKSQDQVPGLKQLVDEAKTHHNVKYVILSFYNLLYTIELLIYHLSAVSVISNLHCDYSFNPCL